MRRITIGICLLSAWASQAHAGCYPTPSTAGAMQHYPGRAQVISGSNLLQPAGKSVPAAGTPLRLHGQVLDSACHPVSGAVVELWQANAEGVYQFADAASLANPYATFAGSGRAISDNRGNVEFLTLVPAPAGNEGAARLHIRLSKTGFSPIATEFTLAETQSVPAQNQLELVPMSDGSQAADLLLVLPGQVPYAQ